MSDIAKKELAPMDAQDVTMCAVICHEVNRAYSELIGDHSHKGWKETPKEIQDSARNGVLAYVKNPEITARQLHANWCEYKRKEGWTYGSVKDADRKTHPCLVEYEMLPEEQKVKDCLFQAVMRSVQTMRQMNGEI